MLFKITVFLLFIPVLKLGFSSGSQITTAQFRNIQKLVRVLLIQVTLR